MEQNKIVLYATDHQLKRWSSDANLLDMNVFEYMKHAVDAYYNFCHQHDIPQTPLMVLEEKFEDAAAATLDKNKKI